MLERFLLSRNSLDANERSAPRSDIALNRIGRPANWGAGATLALSLLSAIGITMAQGIGVLPVILYRFNHFKGKRTEDWAVILEELATQGLTLSLSIYSGGIAAVFFVILWSTLRGWSWLDYLAIRGFSWKSFRIGFAGLAIFLVLTYPSGEAADQRSGDFTVQAYQTAVFPFLFITALVVVAPIWEELFFRGFMHRGLAAAWGPTPAIIFCSACWAMVHVQYDYSLILVLFLVGIFFGFTRQLSGSTLLTVLLHASMNGVAIIEMIVHAGSVAN